MDPLIINLPALPQTTADRPQIITGLRLKAFAPAQPIAALELWAYLAPEQQQKAMQVLVITCRQLVERLTQEPEAANED